MGLPEALPRSEVLGELVQGIGLPQRAECTLKIIYQCSGCVSLTPICPNAWSKMDVMIYWRFLLSIVREVRLLARPLATAKKKSSIHICPNLLEDSRNGLPNNLHVVPAAASRFHAC